MSAKAATPDQIISLPKGGGALRGIGENFAPDLHTGTGNFSVPIELPPGRNGFEPQLQLAYSTGNPNGQFGLGWSLSVPGIARKTSKGVPRYEADNGDTFVLSGAEDLVAVPGGGAGMTRYRPRTEDLFARIVHHQGAGEDYWEVRSKDGLVSFYGRPPQSPPTDSAEPVIRDPNNPRRVFAWRLSRTVDPFGNRIDYAYERDAQRTDGPHEWDQLYLREIRYVDYGSRSAPEFLVGVAFSYEPRPDPFSDYRPGFEVRTARRCRRIDVWTNPGTRVLTRSYHLSYGGPTGTAPANRVSLLTRIEVEGHDGALSQRAAPLELGYTAFEPQRRRFQPLSAVGDALPERSLADRDFELVDLFGNGLPSVVQLNGVARYWRNMGGGLLDLPRSMRSAPPGVSLDDSGVQVADVDGDGRPDLLVTDGVRAGYFPLGSDGGWDRDGFVPYREAPAVELEEPQVRLMDLEGTGVIGALRTASSFELYFNDREDGWNRVELRPRRRADLFPNVSFSDERVRLADMSGDGLQDIVLIHQGGIEYWPYLGHGRWGRRVQMGNPPLFEDAAQFAPLAYDPRRILLGDVDGDGCADLIYVGSGHVTVWINQAGNRWSDPITIDGTPEISNVDAVRLADMLGTGPGILWTYDFNAHRDSTYKFLELTGGTKPYLLSRIDNQMGAVTEIEYAPSTRFYLEDEQRPETRWRTTLPFPVQVVATVRTYDAFSGGKLTSEFSYHHGQWDGPEQENRGFARVHQRDTEVFEEYNAPREAPFAPVPSTSFSPPMETRTWFHLGPVGPEFGDWESVDFSGEFYDGDISLLPKPEPPPFQRRQLRDAVRSLRGRMLRTEVYALDGSPSEDRPLTVTEHSHAVRVEANGVYFPHLVAERTTQWERGDDPMTSVSFIGGYDEYGQPTSHVDIAAPRRGSGGRHLATQTVTLYAQRDDAERYIVDRVARETRYEVADQGSSSPLALHEAITAGTAPRKVIGQTLNFYDGAELEGLDLGEVEEFGALVRTERLVLTEDLLRESYGPRPPPYMTSNGTIAWPEEYPQGFRTERDGAATGYIFRAGGADNERGFFTSTERRSYDFHVAGEARRGLVLVRRDARDARTRVTYDRFGLLPTRAEDAVGLVRSATYDYRVLAPAEVRDANDNRTRFAYSPLGLVQATAAMGKEGEEVGDTPEQPGTTFTYDLRAAERGEPPAVHTLRRVQHRWDVARAENDRRAGRGEPPLTAAEIAALFPVDEPDRFPDRFIRTTELSDGFGRVLQTRSQAEDVVFGDPARGDSGLPLDQGAAPGEARPQADDRGGPRVLVSGWQVYDNKGRVVETYEPFFDRGFAFASPTAEQRGQVTRLEYDALGRALRTTGPDGSQQLVVRGIPAALSNPNSFEGTPWVTFTYDGNDNAGRTHPVDSSTYYDHWNTPSSTLVDALGRTVETVERLGPAAADQITTRSAYDIRGNLISVTDPLGRRAFTGVYDLLDRAWRTDELDPGLRRMVRDAAGNLIEERDGKDAVRLRAFDALNRLTRVWARDRAGERLTLRERLVYGDGGGPRQNLRGRVLEHFDEAGLATNGSYDFKGNVLEQTRRAFRDEVILAAQDAASSAGWVGAAFRVDWEGAATESLLEPAAAAHQTSTLYDALDRPILIRYPRAADGSRPALRARYNRSGAVAQIELDGTVLVERIAYNARGQRILVALGSGLMTRYTYETRTFRLGRMRTERFTRTSELAHRPAGDVLQDLGYRYDLSGNLVALRDRTPGSGVPSHPNLLDRAFTYDPLYRIKRATGRECDAPPQRPWDASPRCTDMTRTREYSETYEYDAAGNLKVLRNSANGGGFTRVLTPAADSNRLATATVARQPFAYAHDAVGNLVEETTSRHFEWDHADRLQTFREQAGGGPPSVYAQYLYDASGQRIKKLVRKGPGIVEVTVYVGGSFEHRRETRATTVAESSTVRVLDASLPIAEVRRGPPLGGSTAPALAYELADHLGSSNVVTDPAGAPVARGEYTPFGEASFGRRYRFCGKERDEESGLNYHGARYYAPWLARWLTCDPARASRGGSQYAYASDRPLNLVDSNGRQPAPPPATEPPRPPVHPAPATAERPPPVSTESQVEALAPEGTIRSGFLKQRGNMAVSAAAQEIQDSAAHWQLLADVSGWEWARKLAESERATAALLESRLAPLQGEDEVAGAKLADNFDLALALLESIGAAAAIRGSRPRSNWKYRFQVGRAGEIMAKYSLKRSAIAGPDYLMNQKFTLKDETGKTRTPSPGSRKGTRYPDLPIKAAAGAVGTLEVKTTVGGSPLDPLIYGASSKQLSNEAKIMCQGPTFWGPADALTPVVAGEGPGVSTGWWVWKPPRDVQ